MTWNIHSDSFKSAKHIYEGSTIIIYDSNDKFLGITTLESKIKLNFSVKDWRPEDRANKILISSSFAKGDRL